MASHSGPNIIEDNLYICFDAANMKSYPGSGTTWTDMSTGFVGIMSNMTASDYTSGAPDYFTFDNSVSDDAAGHKQSIDITSLTPSITIPPITWVSWLRRKQSCFSTTTIGVSDVAESGTGTNWKRYYMRIHNGNKLRYYWASHSSTYNYNPNITIPEDEWVMCALSVSSSSATLYMFELDGTISQGTNTTTHVSATYPITDGPFSIGKLPYEINNTYFGGDIAIVQIYTKALSQAELTQNFNATKGRFLL